MLRCLFLLTIFLTEFAMAQNIQFAQDLYHSYENYKERTLTNRRFKHSDILPLIEQLKDKDIFGVNKVGESAEGRDINMISVGSGSTKIFLWSQKVIQQAYYNPEYKEHKHLSLCVYAHNWHKNLNLLYI